MVALGLDSGAVHAKATTSGSTCLSSFEAELDGLTTILKSVIRIRHILQELLPDFTTKGIIYSDNEALVNFVNGDGPMAKGVRHIEIRQWFTRDTIQKGQFELIHMPGKEIPADKLTKLGNISEHAAKFLAYPCFPLIQIIEAYVSHNIYRHAQKFKILHRIITHTILHYQYNSNADYL
jgi:hypothetical protein